MRFRRGHRSRRFGPVTVHVARDGDVAIGSCIRYGGFAWHLPAWPHRLHNVEPCGRGVVVTFKGGAQRLLEPEDAA